MDAMLNHCTSTIRKYNQRRKENEVDKLIRSSSFFRDAAFILFKSSNSAFALSALISYCQLSIVIKAEFIDSERLSDKIKSSSENKENPIKSAIKSTCITFG